MSILDQLNALQLNNESGFIDILTDIQSAQLEMKNMLKNLDEKVSNMHVEISEISLKQKSEETKMKQKIRWEKNPEELEEKKDDYSIPDMSDYDDSSTSSEVSICIFPFVDDKVRF